MQQHYDPRYEKHRARMEAGQTELSVGSLSPADLTGLADRIATLLPTLVHGIEPVR
jgi:tRNA 2-selenouridine synthase